MKGQPQAVLREAGLKVTAARMALVESLWRGHGPYSPEQLFKQMPDGICDLVTVYRALSQFEDKGLVRRCDFGDGVMRYEWQSGGSHHHHLVCRECGNVRPLPTCQIPELEPWLKESGYREISHRLEFFGVCSGCQR